VRKEMTSTPAVTSVIATVVTIDGVAAAPMTYPKIRHANRLITVYSSHGSELNELSGLL
jgi:hypothetical protein